MMVGGTREKDPEEEVEGGWARQSWKKET